MKLKYQSLFYLLFLIFAQCKQEPETLFVLPPTEDTGVNFINQVIQSGDNHVLNYSYFFNGGGVALGDINNDGLVDIYLSANQQANKLFLNKGDFKFEDITARSGVAASSGWKTGVTMTDVNMDGWLDIYVCRSAMSDSTLRKNLLFINNKDLTFTERAAELGVDDDSYSTHAAFFDYDNDQDLDLFVLNHSLPRYAGFSRLLSNLKNEKGGKFGSKLYQNQSGKFINVTENSGLINNVLSFGLGLAISDLNQDGFLDMYISNDFNEEDYMYMNNGDGTFTNTITQSTDHVSLFSMGSDIADINNDGFTDIYTLDMLPASNERIKLSSGDDNYDKYQLLIQSGFHHQTMRNMLQLNNGDGTFSEIGQLAGISNTDWSWAALFTDFDGDGWKDLYVSNGYEKDYTNMQFLKYTVDEKVKSNETGVPLDLQTILNNMPSINEGNFIFKNNGNLTFSDKTTEWGFSIKNKSNGAAYADLDNDGDLDLVVNVMNAPSLIYKNTSSEKKTANFVKVDLFKNNSGVIVTGSKIYAHLSGNSQFFEYLPIHGYESSMMVPVSIGLGKAEQLDSLSIIWPDGKTTSIKNIKAGSILEPFWQQSRGSRKAESVSPTYDPYFISTSLISWKQQLTEVNDFKRQLLLPHMYSYSGPRMATGDVNGDGLDDVFICGAKDQAGAIFMQQKDGSLKPISGNSFASDKESQDEHATLFDADGDNDLDLYVVSGGYLFDYNDARLQDRLYLNDGKGNFLKAVNAIPEEREAGSIVTVLDIDGDKDNDLFVGGRITPGQYPVNPKSLLLINDGKGKFTNETETLAPRIQYTGMVCDARSIDLNKDGLSDLVITGEWMAIQVWMNHNGKLQNETMKWFPYANRGWWNCISADDFDNDGDIDLIAGNAGTNNQFNISENAPATLIFKDFNGDNQVDPFLCYYIQGKSYPYASRDEALGQVSFLKPRFPDYVSYANASMETIFLPQELQDTVVFYAQETKSSYFENNGGYFKKTPLPVQAQFTPIYSVTAIDINQDGLKDIITGGNESWVRVRLGRNSSSKGMVFSNKGNGTFEHIPNQKSGIELAGDVREISTIKIGTNINILVGSIGNPIQSYRLKTKSN